MTPDTARRTAQHARRLLTAGIITPYDYAVLDALLWRLRRHGRPDLSASYSTIARLAGCCRDTAIGAVRKLVELGVLTKLTRRVKVRWGRGKECVASRQAANGYVFRVQVTESAPQPVDRGEVRLTPLESALARLGAAIQGGESPNGVRFCVGQSNAG